MALKPAERYGGQTNAPNSDYPHGSARDVSVPGDGTGFPLQEDWVNDLLGLEQALLGEAHITPSGDPDTAQVSQYLEAILTLIADRTAVAAVTNFFHQFTDPDIGAEASSGRAIIWNPVNQIFYSINKGDSQNPTGRQLRAPYLFGEALDIEVGDGLTVHPRAALCKPSGLMVVGGAPASSSQSRYRFSDSDEEWTASNSAKTAGTSGPVCGVYAGGTIEQFFMGYASGEIESSADAETWTNVHSTGAHKSMAFSEPLNLIMSVTGTTTYYTSPDGLAWTSHTAPVAFHTVFWSDSLGAFIATAGTSDAVFYQNETGEDADWTVTTGTVGLVATGRTHVHEYRRVIVVVGDRALWYSIDGMATWVEAVYTLTPAGDPFVFPVASAIDPLRGTLCLGTYQDGFHMMTGRYGQ